MDFWGIEVKPGQNAICKPGNKKVLHLSQASLGVNKKEKGSETVQVFVKVNDQKLVIGTLSTVKHTQIPYDLVFAKDFELSHGSKSTSVFFVGYRGILEGYESDHDIDDSSSEDDIDIDEKLNGKASKKEQGKSTAEKAVTQKVNNEAAKLNSKTEKPKKVQVKADNKVEDEDQDDSDDEDDDFEDSDSDEDMVGAQEDSSEEDEDDSSEEEATPEKVDTGKKRKQDSASKTPIHDKKAKIVTPAQNQKTGGDGKKGAHVHIATPYPSKQGGKPQQTPKSGGSVICKSCNRNFNTENALQAHNKAKHGAAAAK